jgi:hypothetical protein
MKVPFVSLPNDSVFKGISKGRKGLGFRDGVLVIRDGVLVIRDGDGDEVTVGSENTSQTYYGVKTFNNEIICESLINLKGNINLTGTNGCTFGTTPTQKLGFWGTAPIIQPAGVDNATSATGTSALSTYAQLNLLLAQLRLMGLLGAVS